MVKESYGQSTFILVPLQIISPCTYILLTKLSSLFHTLFNCFKVIFFLEAVPTKFLELFPITLLEACLDLGGSAEDVECGGTALYGQNDT